MGIMVIATNNTHTGVKAILRISDEFVKYFIKEYNGYEIYDAGTHFTVIKQGEWDFRQIPFYAEFQAEQYIDKLNKEEAEAHKSTTSSSLRNGLCGIPILKSSSSESLKRG